MKYLNLLIVIFSLNMVFAQNKQVNKPVENKAIEIKNNQQDAAQLILLSKNKGSKIHLRWATPDPSVFQQGNQFGYTLVRETFKRGNKIVSKPEKVTFKLMPSNQSQWTTLAQRNDYAKVIKGYFYDEPIPTTETPDVITNAWAGRLIFISFCADMSPEVAQNLALAYTDSTAKPNEMYSYTLYLNTKEGTPDKQSVKITAGLANNLVPELPKKLEILDYVDSSTTLKWLIPIRTIYSAYNIERSDDNGKTYQRVNESPYLPFGNDAEITYLTYSNKVKQVHKDYLYRVKGLDPFGDESEASNIVRVYAYQTRLVPPKNFRYFFPNPTTALLSWTFPDSLSINIKGFNVYKDLGPNNTHIKANKELITEKLKPIHIDKINPTDENIIYYIAAVDLRDKETLSEPFLVMIQDSIPPKKVSNFKGKIDKKGFSHLQWQKSIDKDVAGYKLYRAEGNARKEMFLVKHLTNTDSIVIDQVALKSSSKYVYYLVVPYDNYVNFSKDNDTLRLILPHVFPPDPPVFSSVYDTDSSVVLKWLPSPSKDVVRYKLHKSYPPDTTKKLLTEFTTDKMLLSFEDKHWDEEIPMIYSLEAIDEELSSGDSCRITVKVPKPFNRAPLQNLRVKYIKKEKKIDLQWAYTCRKPIQKFWIFRKEGLDGSYRKLIELKGDAFQFDDLKIKEDTEYSYYLYVFCTDGTSSSKGTEVSVKIK